MTLAAAIVLSGIFFLTSISPALIAQSETSPTAQATATQTSKQDQTSQSPGTAEPAKPKSDQTSKGSAAKQKSSGKKQAHTKKKVVPVNCDAAPPKPTPSDSDPNAAASGTVQSPGVANGDSQKPCPPAKVVVRQGGITEQSIQLAGGTGGNDASHKRDAAKGMLAATEENLKKMDGQQLTTAQQDSASQIRQFVKQSKSAMAAGDLERAQTLAWKAKLLSDDLVSPGK
jgi:hypothetical protein